MDHRHQGADVAGSVLSAGSGLPVSTLTGADTVSVSPFENSTFRYTVFRHAGLCGTYPNEASVGHLESLRQDRERIGKIKKVSVVYQRIFDAF